jgi:uncharacterized membrane protein
MVNYKSMWESKLFWINFISILIEVAQAIAGLNWVPSGTLVVVVNILNIILRRFTDQPVRFK